jgi:hypothetical protein
MLHHALPSFICFHFPFNVLFSSHGFCGLLEEIVSIFCGILNDNYAPEADISLIFF